MARVAALMDEWAVALGRSDAERIRWRAAAMLHDSLRDAPPAELRIGLGAEFRGLPDAYLHGPAAAARLAAEGIDDHDVLEAITYHTLGADRLAMLGRLLIVADYLEPGRADRADWRAQMRARMPAEFEAVLIEVVRAKMQRDLEGREPIRPELVSLWNRLVSDGEARSG
jgi:HD superfamily phosphohydrolase YqeK